ncbi:glycylpeptide N-tetradecanoyltransferase [Puccinia graminis f. sp. tritici]|uniref:Glycylpeptide N-tetradecanoyltransferase n=1 Tax=Puccinia graminis f. sp. tritici TaxID=56615 RepID=A0A5B0PZQ4_PUCGR|nr:glycylpeptide N-tetradecanoyltransferase [Puccinia graminis f. sp. tritici]KAA1109439.1 glycylpeptide N-tetradecanoyltransferase [Puccinia graminis f. sp. tritici]
MSSEPEDQGVIEYGSEVLRPGGDSESNQAEAQGAQSASSRAGPSSNYSPPIGPEDEEDQEEGQDVGLPGGSAGPSTKKKKKKSKGKALSKNPSEVPADDGSLVEDHTTSEAHKMIIEQIRAQNGDEVADRISALGPKELGKMMDQIRLLEMMDGKSGGTHKNKKDMADHKFWATQPVRRLDEQDSSFEEGEIEPSKSEEEIRKSPLALPDGYEWCTLDLGDESQLRELYELLTVNYVEDDDAMFRFDYTAPFIEWALRPPGFVQDWHAGVRVASGKRRLIAFIAGIPMNLQVRSTRKPCAEINFLCIHKKLRSKRLAPVLIKEITRRCNMQGVFQAIYTAGIFLPTPISRCQYFHRNLNPAKLIATGFSPQPRGVSVARLKRMYDCPAQPQIPGFREIEEKDVDAVAVLLRLYMSRFDLIPVMSDEEVRHNFISGKGTGPVVNGRRNQQVTWTFVVENPTTHLITDLVSFYHLPSTAMKCTPHQTIDAAYLFYYATTAAPSCAHLGQPAQAQEEPSQVVVTEPTEQPNWSGETPEARQILKKRLISLIGDALTMAQQANFDVFNALTLMDNSLFVKELQFGAGDGYLHYYLYNWKVHQIRGGVPGEPGSEEDAAQATSSGKQLIEAPGVGSGIGVVML